MKTIINREYAGEKEAFAPLIGFKVVSVEDGSTNGDFGDITVLTGGWERVTEMWNKNAYKKK